MMSTKRFKISHSLTQRVRQNTRMLIHITTRNIFCMSLRKLNWSGRHNFNIRWSGKPSAHADGLRWTDNDVLSSKCVRVAVSVKNRPGNCWHRVTCLRVDSVRWVVVDLLCVPVVKISLPVEEKSSTFLLIILNTAYNRWLTPSYESYKQKMNSNMIVRSSWVRLYLSVIRIYMSKKSVNHV